MRSGGTAEAGTEIKPVFSVEDRIPVATMEALRAKGYQVRSTPNDYVLVNGIIIDPVTRFRIGGADPRGDGYVAGW
ncbi:MAG: hypothetical protein JOZ62_13240 [Acidobacteriaceae bacterium]|nr:hypothetical protein [Acidobacteriaceae bacterium]